jgi:glycosyltransferase involved in cell wall biosynthesis
VNDADSASPLPRTLSIPGEVAPGVNLVGFLEGELGLGENPRRLARALMHADIPFAAIPYRRTPSRQEHPVDFELSSEAPFDTNLICLNADYLHAFVGDVGTEFFANRYSIGVWAWETSVFAGENLPGFRFLDEVWTVSTYVRRAVSAHSDIPVHVVPIPVEEPPAPSHTRADLGLPEGFMFLFVFDFVSSERKNPGAVIEAFTRAFKPGEGPVLVLKSINGQERKPHLLEELVAAASRRPDVHVVDSYFSADEKEAAIAACDCYVSLHRSEGMGLTMAEAMAHGKPVIATGYSGNLDFMDDANSYLVPYRLVPVPEDWWAYAPGAEWAEPDVMGAAALMRRVYEQPKEAAALGERGRADILRTLSVERAAAFVADRLADARACRGTAARSPRYDVRTPILRSSSELSKGVGAGLASRSGRSPTALVRRLLLRFLWPELARSHEVDTTMVEALRALERSRDHDSERLSRLEAALLRGDEANGGAARSSEPRRSN